MTTTIGSQARRLTGDALDAAFVDAERRTSSLVADFDDARRDRDSGWDVPRLASINPPLWEVAHLAWFSELWVLRDPVPVAGPWQPTRPSLLADADRWFDSSRVAHDTRWTLDLPDRATLADYAARVAKAILAKRAVAADDDDALYPFRLALFHHDMHNEALTVLRQTLDDPAPAGVAPLAAVHRGEVECAGGPFTVGRADAGGFSFDNERPRVTVAVAPFAIDRDCVSNDAYRAFVDAGGYGARAAWSPAGRQWLDAAGRDRPARWRRGADGWEDRWFGAWRPLPLDAPVCHVTAFEAEAFAAWAGRRLPTEAEWERAAATDAIRWGDGVWEWTASAFAPYPGFVADRYRDYSEPWFHTHRVVRGGSFATAPRMRHPRYRNFYVADRDDVFVGFRTCRL